MAGPATPGPAPPIAATLGWLPIDIEFDPEPAVVTSAAVRWIEFGETPLAEPFFHQTVENLRQAAPAATELDTSLEAMLRMSDRLPAAAPAGFIFHVSHCGSTLVANALKSATGTVVAAEAGPFVRLARWYPEAASPYLRERWHSTRRRLFDSLFRLFAHYRTGEPERLVVKFCSLNLFDMQFVRQCWPQTPCVVLVRDPLAVLVSTLHERGWLAHKDQPELVRMLYGWRDLPQPPSEMPDEEYCARLLGRHMAAAIESIDDRCKVIDYEDLNPKRIREIAAFFGLELPAAEGSLDGVFRTYSKDPANVLPFRDDRAAKRRLASRAAGAAAHRWAMPAYIELRARGGKKQLRAAHR